MIHPASPWMPQLIEFGLWLAAFAAVLLYVEAVDYRRDAGKADAYRTRGDDYFDKWYALRKQIDAEHEADAALDRETERWKRDVQQFASAAPNRVKPSPSQHYDSLADLIRSTGGKA